MDDPIYLIDASVLIDFQHYPVANFPSFWRKLDDIIKEGRLRSCHEVYNEIGAKLDTIADWVKTNKAIFDKPNYDEMVLVGKVLDRFPFSIKKVNIESGKPAADPFLIAAAKVHGYALLTNESYKPHGQKIPNICEFYEVDCLNWHSFLQREAWVF